MGPIQWFAVRGLPKEDRARGKNIYAAIKSVERGTDPEAFEDLFTADPDGYRQITHELARRDPFLEWHIEQHDGMRGWFCLDE